jgi:hypothetical protein
MKIWNVYDDEIREIAAEVGLKIHGDYGGRGIRRVGRAYQFRLALNERLDDGTLRFQRLGFSGRGIHLVCWHGYREFFFALYRRFPDAYIRTGVTTYMNREHFRRSYRETQGLTVSGWAGVHADSGCVCQRARAEDAAVPTVTPANWAGLADYLTSSFTSVASTLSGACTTWRSFEWNSRD